MIFRLVRGDGGDPPPVFDIVTVNSVASYREPESCLAAAAKAVGALAQGRPLAVHSHADYTPTGAEELVVSTAAGLASLLVPQAIGELPAGLFDGYGGLKRLCDGHSSDYLIVVVVGLGALNGAHQLAQAELEFASMEPGVVHHFQFTPRTFRSRLSLGARLSGK